MGWPLAVSAALMERKQGHVQSIGRTGNWTFSIDGSYSSAVFLMASLVTWESQIRITAGILVILFGIYLLINRRHPRILARIPPSRLALWSFLAALAHGAGLMLVPIYLGLCAPDKTTMNHAAATTLMAGNMTAAIWVSGVHTLAMTTAGGILAILMYVWLGLRFLSKTFFNLDIVWALSLVLVGAFGVYSAVAS